MRFIAWKINKWFERENIMKVNSLNLFNYYNNSFKGAQPKSNKDK